MLDKAAYHQYPPFPREGGTVSTNRRTNRILRDGATVLELELLLLDGEGLRGNSCGRFVG
jgi:hypothetical protein